MVPITGCNILFPGPIYDGFGILENGGEPTMTKFHKNKILEIALQQLKEKLIRQHSKERRRKPRKI